MAHEQPNITYQWEKFPDIVREALPLMQKNWEEVDGREGFELDFDLYYNLHRLGILRVFTARRNTVLVGYITVLVTPDEQRRSVSIATVTTLWLDPLEREGWVGYRFIKLFTKDLSREGVESASLSVKIDFRNDRGHGIEPLLKRLGYEAFEIRFRKNLRSE